MKLPISSHTGIVLLVVVSIALGALSIAMLTLAIYISVTQN